MSIDTIVAQAKEERDSFLAQTYVERELISTVQSNKDSTLIHVITGPRRAGKSVFSIMFLKNHNFAYLNFDDERLLDIKDYDDIVKSLHSIYGEFLYILFDEIQNLPNWELFVNRLQRQGYKIVVTGSNAHLLSRELATHLTGRHLSYTLLSFSFREFLSSNNIDYTKHMLPEVEGEIKYYLKEYLHQGGIPEVVTTSINKKDYIITLVENIVFKDVVTRHNIRLAPSVYTLAKHLISNCSKEFTLTRLKNKLGFSSVNTVKEYIEFLKEAFLLYELPRFSYKVPEQQKSPKKIYVPDNGIVNSFSFQISPNSGQMLENTVATELFRKKSINKDLEIYYWKENSHYEVDFVIKKGSQIKELVQASYVFAEEDIDPRELKGLTAASNALKCDTLTLITWDLETKLSHKEKTIECIPLWKWLVEQK